MPYSSDIHASISYVSKEHKALLQQLCDSEKRSEKAELEHLIEQAAKLVLGPDIG